MREYSLQISDSDVQLNKLRDLQKQSEQRKTALKTTRRDQIAKLDV